MNKKPYILCVDDDTLNLSIIENYLEENYESSFAANGQECLDSVSDRIPDLILLDIMMPVLNGVEVCKILKNDEKTQDIPIIILTARSYDNEMRGLYKLGIDAFITKPFTEKHLIEMIEDRLE